jgi:pimeloyl-ACP methyl ester carboxylesterase
MTSMHTGSDETAMTAARPPGQPPSGPGGADYPHASFSQQLIGRGGRSCWFFTPNVPVPEAAPVVVFFHGWSGVNPVNYGGWIAHLAQRGRIVLFPVYQTSSLSPFKLMMRNALDGIRAGLRRLEEHGPVRPLTDRCAFVGHSLGGLIAAQCAALGPDQFLPNPSVLMPVQPGGSRIFSVPLEGLNRVPAHTLALVVAGEEDEHLPMEQPLAVYTALTSIPEKNRNFIVIRSDRHGSPPLIADHSAPLSERADVGPRLTPEAALHRDRGLSSMGLRHAQADALAFYGHWKLLDAAMAAAFDGQHREAALGNTPVQRFMGIWSDGVPVKELLVSTRPDGRMTGY